MKSWLSYARTTDSDLKRAFITSLKELLKSPKIEEEREKCNEIVRRLFSNITTPHMFPDMGSEHQSVEYLVKYSDVPFEDMERLGLATIKHLIGWEWGMRAFFGNSIGVGYILNRGGTGKAKVLLETKYRII